MGLFRCVYVFECDCVQFTGTWIDWNFNCFRWYCNSNCKWYVTKLVCSLCTGHRVGSMSDTLLVLWHLLQAYLALFWTISIFVVWWSHTEQDNFSFEQTSAPSAWFFVFLFDVFSCVLESQVFCFLLVWCH